MAEELSDFAKKELEAGRAAKEKSMEEFARRTKGKPTPTQVENDEAKLGKHFMQHEPDGSDPEGETEQRAMHGSSGGSYQTRQSTPQHRAPRSES